MEKKLRDRSYVAGDTVIQIEGINSTYQLFNCNKVFGEDSNQE
jgi:hypothetical protein